MRWTGSTASRTPLTVACDGATILATVADVAHRTFALCDGVRPCRHARRCQPLSCDPMARKKLPPVTREDARAVGALLRSLRKAAGYRAVQDAASANGFPAARQTIYAYERGGLTPSLQQFLELVEFYGMHPIRGDGTKPEEDLRAQAVAAGSRALTLRAYHVQQARELIERLQPPLTEGRRRS
jgi:transcriptional regulator with XRE-family HTH domain